MVNLIFHRVYQQRVCGNKFRRQCVSRGNIADKKGHGGTRGLLYDGNQGALDYPHQRLLCRREESPAKTAETT